MNVFLATDIIVDRINALSGLLGAVGAILGTIAYLRSGHAIRQSDKSNTTSDAALAESHRACERTYKTEGKVEAHQEQINQQAAQSRQNTQNIQQLSKDMPPPNGNGNGGGGASFVAQVTKQMNEEHG